jgi:adenylosuccinate synthase
VQQQLSELGQVSAVIGAQWGDEGKGKIIDLLTEEFDVVARACGGANAGHTIVVGGKKHVFRLLPSGCLHDGKTIVLGSGMVIHVPTLLEELDLLEQAGITLRDRLWISHEAHIVFDYHKEIDGVMEDRRSAQKGEGIGTTRRGIGPAYMDKAERTGVRMERLGTDLSAHLRDRAESVRHAYGVEIDVAKEAQQIADAHVRIGSRITDTVELLHRLRSEDHRIIVEGAQATMLDLDHGTYPYVTSSFTTVAGALQGLGLPPFALDSCIGVAKAYCTRVGSGDFLTEVHGDTADRLRERGGEYGSVTKRPRRCGWLHIPDLQRSSRINGYTYWNITKLDVLDEEEVIPVGIAEKNGKAVYKEFAGWKTSTAGMTDFDALPKEAQALIGFIEEQTDIPVRFLGTGQGREEMILKD